MKIVRYLKENYFDLLAELEKGNFPDVICLLYVNPFNYFWFRASVLPIEVSQYRLDGIFASAVFRSLVLRRQVVRRQSFDMTSLAPLIFIECERRKLSVFVAGGSSEDSLEFRKKLLGLFPNLDLRHCVSGFLSETELVDLVVSANCDVTILGLGNIKQESVAVKLASVRPSRYFTCGAFISQTASSADGHYYPRQIHKLNLRWLYRLFSESHILGRVVKFYPYFVVQLMLDLFASASRNR
jgi:UDP-N-acetyl-D-mannosaminuronic acid transferase (WecB/TagA/CpsF family)